MAAAEFELLAPGDKPALIAIATPDYVEFFRATLVQMGYKVHVATTPDEFTSRFAQVMYEVVIVEETFGGATLAENAALVWLQKLPMARRRHATTMLVGMSFQTLHVMQAYQQSVHAVINPAELASLPQIIQKVVSDNLTFLHTFREVQKQMSTGKS